MWPCSSCGGVGIICRVWLSHWFIHKHFLFSPVTIKTYTSIVCRPCKNEKMKECYGLHTRITVAALGGAQGNARPSAWLRTCGSGPWASGRVTFGPTPKNENENENGVSSHSAPRVGAWADGLLLPGPIVQFTRHSRPLCSQLWMPCAWMAVNLNRHSRRILLSAGHRCWCEQMVSAP